MVGMEMGQKDRSQAGARNGAAICPAIPLAEGVCRPPRRSPRDNRHLQQPRPTRCRTGQNWATTWDRLQCLATEVWSANSPRLRTIVRARIRVSSLPSPATAEHIMGVIRLAPTALPAMKPRRVSACRTASPIRLHIASSSRKASSPELREDTPGPWFTPSEELLFPYRHLVFRADACVLSSMARSPRRSEQRMRFLFEDYALDTNRRELCRRERGRADGAASL